jgi:hypothetical protein
VAASEAIGGRELFAASLIKFRYFYEKLPFSRQDQRVAGEQQNRLIPSPNRGLCLLVLGAAAQNPLSFPIDSAELDWAAHRPERQRHRSNP